MKKQLVVMCRLRVEKPRVFLRTGLWLCKHAPLPSFIQPHTNLASYLSLSLFLSPTPARRTRTLSWFINEQIARGDGKRRLDDLRVIEVDAREDEKCVCACVLCLCAFEGRIEANG